jgi:hypothetical protein
MYSAWCERARLRDEDRAPARVAGRKVVEDADGDEALASGGGEGDDALAARQTWQSATQSA